MASGQGACDSWEQTETPVRKEAQKEKPPHHWKASQKEERGPSEAVEERAVEFSKLKYILGRKMTPLVIVTILLASGANTCVKWFDGSTVARIASIVLNGASFITMSYTLQSEEIGKVQVTVSSGMITSSVLIGSFLFKETVTVYKALAIGFALTSIYMNILSPKKELTPVPSN
jgi:multidrug transporter EmrE-like cation transporter